MVIYRLFSSESTPEDKLIVSTAVVEFLLNNRLLADLKLRTLASSKAEAQQNVNESLPIEIIKRQFNNDK